MLQTGIFRDAIWPAKAADLKRELRTSLENPATPLSYPAEWLLDIFNGGRTDSGIRVSEMTALQVSDVYACVDIIGSAIASQPLNVYERIEVGEKFKRHAKRLATDHALYDVLRYEPNEEMTTHTFIKTLQTHMLLWGNAYAEIERDGAGRPVALWPHNPSQTKPRRSLKSGVMFYETTDGMRSVSPETDDGRFVGLPRAIRKEDMIHIPGLSIDGRMGQDVVQLARQLIGLYLAIEKHAAKFFGNGAIPGGVLTTPAMLKDPQVQALKRTWQEAQGGENQHRVAVLENGMKYEKIGTTPSEAQMVDARKAQRSEVAALFHVPVTMLGETGASRANAEQVALEFVNYTLSPWVSAWEQELKRKLFPQPPAGRNAAKVFFAKIDCRRLTMPDAAAKKEFYSAGIQWGFLNDDDAREFEDLNPKEDGTGSRYWRPVNMAIDGPEVEEPDTESGEPLAGQGGVNKQPAGAPQGPGAGGQGSGKSDDGGAPAETNSLRAAAAYLRPFKDAVGRALTRKNLDYRTFERIFSPAVHGLAEMLLMLRDSGFQPGSALPEKESEAARDCLQNLYLTRSEWMLTPDHDLSDLAAAKMLDGCISDLRS
ncbi:MAG TPA: phage portal protein [Terriglobia bacterium]|nr:phage portal protein [Terriglobia bacterium]